MLQLLDFLRRGRVLLCCFLALLRLFRIEVLSRESRMMLFFDTFFRFSLDKGVVFATFHECQIVDEGGEDPFFAVGFVGEKMAQHVEGVVLGRPLEDLVLLAQALSSHRLDEAGVLAPLDADQLRRAWETLRARYPGELGERPPRGGKP